MSKTLIIAEKPSVALDISKALGGFKKEGEYYESKDYVLSSALGHLVEIAAPDSLEKRKGKWTFNNLPVIPDAFELRPIAKTEERLKLLKKLISRKDVTALINACDAGREGELIFRYIVKYCGAKKPIKRLWMQSMTRDAILEGFEHLRDGAELEPLHQAAVCRSESDWLVGINGTRALTAFNSKKGGFQLTTVGRVQTPTLAMVVERDNKIKNFVPKDYWELHGTFVAQAGEYPGRWFDEKFKKSEKEEEADLRAERLWDKAKAESIAAKCRGKKGVVTEEKKPTTQAPPLLYDLTTLQREANSRFGLPARRTLQIAQALYEKHKVLTYPRTDSRALPEDYIPTVRKTLAMLKKTQHLGEFAGKVLTEEWIKPDKRIFNNAKISDHFAIIPTQLEPKKLDEMEQKIYDMVAKRFIAIFYPSAQFEITTRITRIEGESFKSEGKVMKDPGWLAVYGKEEVRDEDSPSLVPVRDNETVDTKDVEVKGLQTRPPARFTEATLLSAMEGAGKLVEDEELRDAMGAKGIGTPATRAAIIEGLIHEEYMRREGRELHSTAKAWGLIELLEAIKIETLTSPEMTGEWEFKLNQMEKGQLSRDAFMREISDLTRQIVDKARNFEEDGMIGHPCAIKGPNGEDMIETLRNYQTLDGSFAIRKVIAGRMMEPQEIQELITKKFVGPISGFRSRAGWPFTAALRLSPENKTEFVFDNAPIDNEGKPLDLTKVEPVGKCPIDGGRVIETMLSYACEHSFGDNPKCKFKIGKKILEQPISREQAAKLLTEKKTDLLTAFISNRKKRRFSAYLVLSAEGKVGFEFQERKEGAPHAFRGKKAPAAGAKNSAATDATATPAQKSSRPFGVKNVVTRATRAKTRRSAKPKK
jgi:DNA topoisomerase-3